MKKQVPMNEIINIYSDLFANRTGRFILVQKPKSLIFVVHLPFKSIVDHIQYGDTCDKHDIISHMKGKVIIIPLTRNHHLTAYQTKHPDFRR